MDNHGNMSSEKTRTSHPGLQQYYANQVGGGQSIYRARLYQRGHIFEDVLCTLFMTVAPMLRNIDVGLGKDILRSGIGARAMTDIVAGTQVIIYLTIHCGERLTYVEKTIEAR